MSHDMHERHMHHHYTGPTKKMNLVESIRSALDISLKQDESARALSFAQTLCLAIGLANKSIVTLCI